MEQHPIFKLPPELLALVFAHLAQAEPLGDIAPESDDEDEEEDDVPNASSSSDESSADSDYSFTSCSSIWPAWSIGWTRVTQVCTLFRSVALGTPALWETIPLGLHPEWVDVLVERSSWAPVDVLVLQGAEESRVKEHIVDIGTPRIRSVVSESTSIDILQLLVDLGTGAPLLKEMDIAFLHPHLSSLASISSLRKVRVNVYPFDGTLPALSQYIQLPNLTELDLSTRQDVVIPLSPLWMSVFQGLTVLRLSLVRFDLDGPDAPSFLEFPRLRELKLVESGTHCGKFLCRVLTPPTTRYNVRYQEPIFSKEDPAARMESQPFIRVLDKSVEQHPLRALVITHTIMFVPTPPPETSRKITTVLAHGWRAVRGACDENDDGPPDFGVDERNMAAVDADIAQVVELVDDEQLRNFARVLLMHPRLCMLHTLALDLHPSLTQDRADLSANGPLLQDSVELWTDALQSMEQLCHLRITSPFNRAGTPLNILWALKNPNPARAPIVQRLRSLTLVDWDPNVDASGRRMVPEEGLGSSMFPGYLLRSICKDREGALKTVYIKNWRLVTNHNADWRAWLKGIGAVSVVYEDVFLSLDHIGASDNEE